MSVEEDITTMLEDTGNNENDNRYSALYQPFSRRQETTTLIVGNASALLSMFGSVSILYLIWVKNRRRNKRREDQQQQQQKPTVLFHRIMCGISLSDLISSFAFLLQPFLVPKWSHQLLGIGTTATCEIAAFFSILAITSHLYSGILALYFVLTIRYGWTVTRASRCLEPWIHVGAWCLPGCVGLAAIVGDVFNPRPLLGVCLTGHFPVDCFVNPNVECERGGDLRGIFLLLLIGMSFVAGLVGIVCTWLVLRGVKEQYRKNERFDFRRSVFPALRESTVTDTQLRRRQAVARQAAWYTVSFMNPFLVTLVGSIVLSSWTNSLEQLENLSERGAEVFVVVLLVDWFYSLQGFLNWLVFIRPTMARWRDAYPDRSYLWTYSQMLLGEKTPTTCRTDHWVVPAVLLLATPAIDADADDNNAVLGVESDDRSERADPSFSLPDSSVPV